VFEIGVLEGEPSFSSTGGTTRLDEVSPGVFAPERPTMHLTLSLAGDGAMDMVMCGQKFRYQRVPTSATGKSISGNYRNAGLGIEVAIDGTSMLIRSDVGAMRATLNRIDEDLMLMRGEGIFGRGGWMASLRVTGDGLELTSDRTKGLLLRPV